MSLPWEKNFTPPAVDENLLKEITGAVEGAVQTGTELATSIGSVAAGQIAGQQAAQAVKDIGGVATAVEQGVEGVASAVVPTIAPPPPGSSSTSVGVGSTGTTSTPNGGDWVSAIESAAMTTTGDALKSVLPAVQDRIAHEAEKILAEELGKALGDTTSPPLASIPKADLKKLDAWERAARTLLSGVFVTILGAIVQVIGSLSTDGTHVDFFHQEGWKAVATLAVGAVITSVSTYLMRYLKEPAGAAIDSSTKS